LAGKIDQKRGDTMKNVSVWELAFFLFRSRVKSEDIAKRVGVGRATIYRRLKDIKYRGIKRFIREKKEAKRKRKRRCLDTRVVLKIKKIREDTGWCGKKIIWELKTKHGIKVSQASIYRVLNRYFKLKKQLEEKPSKRSST